MSPTRRDKQRGRRSTASPRVREEGLVAEAREEPEGRILLSAKHNSDAGGAQGVIELADGIGCVSVRDDEPTT